MKEKGACVQRAKSNRYIVLLLTFVILLTACGNNTNNATENTSKEPTDKAVHIPDGTYQAIDGIETITINNGVAVFSGFVWDENVLQAVTQRAVIEELSVADKNGYAATEERRTEAQNYYKAEIAKQVEINGEWTIRETGLFNDEETGREILGCTFERTHTFENREFAGNRIYFMVDYDISKGSLSVDMREYLPKENK